MFIVYTFVTFEAIADEIEQPFGTAPNDLALNAMCLMIETTLMELNGEEISGNTVPKKALSIDHYSP